MLVFVVVLPLKTVGEIPMLVVCVVRPSTMTYYLPRVAAKIRFKKYPYDVVSFLTTKM